MMASSHPQLSRHKRDRSSLMKNRCCLGVFVLLVVSHCNLGDACEFDCRSNTCGNETVEYVIGKFEFPQTNVLTGVTSKLIKEYSTLDLTNRGITSIAPLGLICYFKVDPITDDDDQVFLNTTQAISLENNLLTEMPNLAVFYAVNMLSFRNNSITSMTSNMFGTFSGNNLVVDFRDNLVEHLETSCFGFNGEILSVYLQNNLISSSVQAVFQPTSASDMVYLDMSNNLFTSEALKSALTSYTRTAASLTLKLNSNRITQLPSDLFQNISLNEDYGVFNDIVLDLSYNPITAISSTAFNGTAWLKNVLIDMSFCTNGPIVLPDTLYFIGVTWDRERHGFLKLNFAATAVSIHLLRAVTVYNSPSQVELDLSFNNYTQVPAEAFKTTQLQLLNLSHNNITAVTSEAFEYTFNLQTLDLSHNNIAILEVELVNTFPILGTLDVSNNNIWAMPVTSNHISSPLQVKNNIIECDGYGPALRGCRCLDPTLTYNEHCGYGRCTRTENGCAKDRLYVTSCELAPFSQCLATCSQGEYYDTKAQTCLAIDDCATIFEDRAKPGAYQTAYEVYNATVSSNRICSICSACPVGYHTSPCTPTSNSECDRSEVLTDGDVASIVLSVIILAVGTAVGALFGFTQLHKQKMTQGELEMTEMLLGDVTEEKERITEEKDRMKQAWTIDESDLMLQDVIGVGGYGTVYRGRWGHIPVAVKVLTALITDLNPLLTEDFDREVTFMQAIRHPNLITFYGAGINSAHQAYLVTELMEHGSLWKLLQNRALTWRERVSFAKDITKGMRYLHDKGTLHRDLKADNCFVDGDLRVKVADFGTGKLQYKFEQVKLSPDTQTHARVSNNKDRFAGCGSVPNQTRSLTKGTGSLLWMSPEVLRGDLISLSGDASKAIDVYSFGVVMFEIWTRACPWDEVEGNDISFFPKLVDLVCGGARPQLPSGVDVAPEGYAELMESCWSTNPKDRPTFAITLQRLESIIVPT
eukprot:m.139913 g.139913  ORF g.139913 m.139913 type:complete len:982 (-) comp30090_c0_seq3:440-3385(-)